MTLFSTLSASAAVVVSLLAGASEASGDVVLHQPGTIIGIDMLSNGKYWYGVPWSHEPKHGDTHSCVCLTGLATDFEPLVQCYSGLSFPRVGEQQLLAFSRELGDFWPVEISIWGDDALWIDRIQHVWYGGNQYYGSNNMSGWCLSTDPHDKVGDDYATIATNRCYDTFTIYPKKILGAPMYRLGNRFYKFDGLPELAKAKCNALKRGRRRVEEIEEVEEDSRQQPAEEEDFADASDDAEVSPLSSEGIRELHAAIRGFAASEGVPTDEEIDEVLDRIVLADERKVDGGEVGEAAAADGGEGEYTRSALEEALLELDDAVRGASAAPQTRAALRELLLEGMIAAP